ncbi:MAG: hypothetical protein FWE68_06770 [Defluviitaleaceae bacterium]|nr:hypothetical protein [Defluviitaleaceae bacterium]
MDKFSPVFNRIDELTQKKEHVIVAIDGNGAAGKSTLAELLKSVYSCNVFRADDFFLQPYQRTSVRLNEPGGNIDYERFEKEIINPLHSGKPFAYRPYDCRTQKLSEPVFVSPTPISVVEGCYCLHPRFGDIYDLKIFLSLDADEQRCRLSARNAELFDRFMQEWVPMENKYFETFQIAAKCELVF